MTLAQFLRASRISRKVVRRVPKFRVMAVSLSAIDNHY